MRNYKTLKTSELRREMKDTVDVPLYTIHMEPEFPSTWLFGGASPSLPAGLFGPGSDPWSGAISCIGDPFDKEGKAPTADLVVRHEKLRWIPNKESRFGAREVPEKFQLRCQMVKLSEVGTQPVTVTYNGGKRSETWNVRVELSKKHPGGGMIYITHVNPDGNGGLADIEIAVKVAFVFSRNGTEVVAESGVEWLSETDHSFARWLDPKSSERFYLPSESVGSFIPATRFLNGEASAKGGCSKNDAVTHSFVLAPKSNEIKGDWGTFADIWQFPKRKG
jgi:hypothetical protein